MLLLGFRRHEIILDTIEVDIGVAGKFVLDGKSHSHLY